MTFLRWACSLCLLAALGAQAQGVDEARAALAQPDAAARLDAARRLAQIGSMDDVDRLAERLADSDPEVRAAATAALWQVWSRSGDAEIDALLAQGSRQIENWAFAEALSTFNEIVRRKPEFAEGWNKRATVLFLMGEHQASLKDCDEVLRRNPKHFGALSGAGQNHAQLGQLELAIQFYQRALRVNPYLPGPAASIFILQRQLSARERNRI